MEHAAEPEGTLPEKPKPSRQLSPGGEGSRGAARRSHHDETLGALLCNRMDELLQQRLGEFSERLRWYTDRTEALLEQLAREPPPLPPLPPKPSKTCRVSIKSDPDMISPRSPTAPQDPPPASGRDVEAPEEAIVAKRRSSQRSGPNRKKTWNLEEEEIKRRLEAQSAEKHEKECGIEDTSPFFQRVVGGMRFEMFWAVVIFTNSLCMGVQVHYAASVAAVGESPPLAFAIIQWVYSISFLVELTFRLNAARWKFFFGSGCGWNWFDIVIVMASLFEMGFEVVLWMSGIESESVDANASSMRVIRLLRVGRLVRVFRVVRIVRFIRALRTLIYSIVCTLRSLVWAMFLMAMILYVFGVLFTQAITDHVATLGSKSDFYTDYWGSLPRSMLTLFQSVSGGVSWDDVLKPLESAGFVWVLLFVVYICFTFFAVLNVVTGVFCQSAIEGAMHDHELAIQEQLKKRDIYVEKVRSLYKELDNDGSDTLTVKELEEHINHPEMQAYFNALEIDTNDAWTLFKLLDASGTLVLSCDDFVMGCMRLKGTAKSIDLAQLMYEQKHMRERLAKFMSAVENRLERLTDLMEANESGGESGSETCRAEQHGPTVRR